jgi:hypothetical protein
MAESYPDPSNGAVTLPSGHGFDVASFDPNESYATESVLAYGTANYDPYRSNATPHLSTDVTGFAKYGAAGKSPGWGAATAGGGSATLTIDTGVTLVGPMVVGNIRLGHSRARAAVPLSMRLENSGDVVTTWPVS